jgi:2-polyprenyl-3-methyl-5-hydroxy-6-metoxy-1,4-benzoquinol methylase
MGQAVYDNDRPEMLQYVPTDATSVLDVGCATGRFGVTLRAKRPGATLHGIDPTPPDPSVPAVYDTRTTGLYPQDLPPGARYDCIVFNDVLEHMVDPWAALVHTRDRLTDRGCVVASIPNVRHLLVLLPLVLKGRWDYADDGLLDRTHLRFFTERSIREMFASTGYDITRLEPARITKPTSVGRVNRMLGGIFTGFIAHQYAVVARVAPTAG